LQGMRLFSRQLHIGNISLDFDELGINGGDSSYTRSSRPNTVLVCVHPSTQNRAGWI
jgi:hypothetical protein